jgi:hypothetical protein
MVPEVLEGPALTMPLLVTTEPMVLHRVLEVQEVRVLEVLIRLPQVVVVQPEHFISPMLLAALQ